MGEEVLNAVVRLESIRASLYPTNQGHEYNRNSSLFSHNNRTSPNQLVLLVLLAPAHEEK